MSALPYPDNFYFDAAEGWLQLGNAAEAEAELNRLRPASRLEPDVLEIEWSIHAISNRWDKALVVARKVVEVAPERAFGWIHQAYSLRRAPGGGLEQAWEALFAALKKFPKEWLIPYNLACYAAQMGRPDEAWEWLHRAMEGAGDVDKIKRMALRDDDLEALRARIATL